MARKQQEPEQQTLDQKSEEAKFVENYISQKNATADSMGIGVTSADVEEWEREALDAYAAQRDTAAAGAEMARQKVLSEEPIPYVSSFDDAVESFGDDVAILDDYEKLDDKEALVGKPFAIMRWWFTPSEIGERGEFAVLKIITKQPLYDPQGVERTKFTIVDGSTGIYAQLRAITDRTGKNNGLICRNGLRASRYEYQGMPAATFYLT